MHMATIQNPYIDKANQALMNAFPQEIQSQLLLAFRRAAEEMPAYRELYREQGVRTDLIVDLESFSRLCPLLGRANTFDKFPIDRLCAGGELGDLAQVLTSSGHGGAEDSTSDWPTENNWTMNASSLTIHQQILCGRRYQHDRI